MKATITRPLYGVFRCEHCADSHCTDSCGLEWADDLPPLWMDEPDDWPACQCCGRRAELVVPLVRAAV
jgi:hypothetical protein